MYTGPNIVNDGLVFGFDTGYPLVSDNLDSYKFNKGEPTTNKLNNTILGQGNGASLDSDDFGTYIQLADITSSYSRLQIPSITVVSNEVYTWSFEIYLLETMTRSGNYTFDTNAYSDQFPSSNDDSRVTATHNRPDTIYANEWTPISLTVTMQDSLTGAYAYDFFNFYYPGFQNQKVYYRNMQFETKGHKSPYAGQGGTRSVSGSLIDLTRTTDIDLSNVSFDSNAQMNFDGTDDRIDLTLNHLSGSAHSEEVVVYRGSADALHGILCDLQYGFYGLMFLANNKIRLRQMQQNPDGEGGWSYPNVNLDTSDTYGIGTYHIVGTFSKTEGFKLYVNGELKASDATNLPFNLSGNRGINHIGLYKSSNSTTYENHLDGKLHIVRCYNSALPSEEVKQNYNAVKSRFGL